MPNGRLFHMRETYPLETAWARSWTADELRQARAGADDARLAAGYEVLAVASPSRLLMRNVGRVC